MSFKFNFSSDGDKFEEQDATEQRPEEAGLAPAAEFFLTEETETDIPFLDLTLRDNTDLKYVMSSMVEQDLKQDKDSSLRIALDQNSDLIPNVYEGGLKVWECSIDLAEYLSSIDIAFRGLKVLELGCGAGLPGLYAFVKGAKVHFQDYNKEVLEGITIPNVYLNTKEDEESDPVCRFFSGDWSLLQEKLLTEMKSTADKYDMILTSETIYSRDNYKKLHDVMRTMLKPSGVVYLAAKVHYFGVGGGLREFENCVREWGFFNIKTCHKITEGVQREIVKMVLKKEATLS